MTIYENPVVMCDGPKCGKLEFAQQPGIVTLHSGSCTTFRHGMADSNASTKENPIDDMHFCSFACLSMYIQEPEDENACKIDDKRDK